VLASQDIILTLRQMRLKQQAFIAIGASYDRILLVRLPIFCSENLLAKKI
jgi:hypothetical protein